MADYTADTLAVRVGRIAALPVNAPGFDATTVIGILNEQLAAEIIPWLISLRGEYLVDYTDTLVSGTTEFFNIPTAAVGSLLREVKLVKKDSDAIESDDEYVDLQQIQPSDSVNCDFPAFVVRGDRIQLINVESYVDYYVRQYYWRRPNDLTAVTNCRQVVTVGSGSVTVASLPSAWTSTPTLDVIDYKPQFRAKSEAVSATTSGVTVTGTFPADIAVGDWLALTGYSPVAQIPDIVYPYLVQMAALVLLSTYPDAGGINAVAAGAKIMRERLEGVMMSRVDGAPLSFVRDYSACDFT